MTPFSTNGPSWASVLHATGPRSANAAVSSPREALGRQRAWQRALEQANFSSWPKTSGSGTARTAERGHAPNMAAHRGAKPAPGAAAVPLQPGSYIHGPACAQPASREIASVFSLQVEQPGQEGSSFAAPPPCAFPRDGEPIDPAARSVIAIPSRLDSAGYPDLPPNVLTAPGANTDLLRSGDAQTGGAPPSATVARGTASARAEPPARGPLRVHAEWTNEGLSLWLGVDPDRSLPLEQMTRHLLHQLQLRLAAGGTRLLRLVCNGHTVWDGSLSGPGSTKPLEITDGQVPSSPEMDEPLFAQSHRGP